MKIKKYRTGWVYIADARWVRTVVWMRILCPLNLIFAVTIGIIATMGGAFALEAIDFFCAGLSLGLSFINWFIYRTQPLGE